MADEGRRSRGRLVAALAAIVFVGTGIAVGVAVLLSGGDDDRAYCEALDDLARSDEPFLAFLDPAATEEDIARVGAAVEAIDGVSDIEFVDQDESFEEAQEMFSEDPTTLDLLRREDVPTSYRFVVADGIDAVEVERDLSADDAVYAVERPEVVRGRTVLEVAEVATSDRYQDEGLGRFGHWIAPAVADELRATAPGAVEEDLELMLGALADDDGEIDGRVQRAADTIIDDAETRCEGA